MRKPRHTGRKGCNRGPSLAVTTRYWEFPLSPSLAPGRHQVTLVTRVGCHLCEAAEATLRRLAGELGFRYEEIDVDGSAQLRDEYSDRVPVILIDGKEHGYWRVEEDRFRRALAR